MDLWQAMESGVDRLAMKLTSYPDAYHRHLARFQGRPVRVLEIGVLGGGSLQMLRSYLGEQATIVGVDIEPACKAHEGERIHVEIGDQGDPQFLTGLIERWAPFDIVIDDGGHLMHQQILTFEMLYPHVAADGVYSCEDTLTSYLSTYSSGERGTFIDLAKSKVDDMHAWFSDEGPKPTEWTRTISSIHFYLGLVIIEKGTIEPPALISSTGAGFTSVPVADITESWKATHAEAEQA